MIQITSLYKVYRSKKRKKCYALNDVNLTLPDAGLVFVLGKSGSGKSTLLNLIGGLDKITSGTIEVDGNDISHISERRMCNYRNSHVGFIFQDYHLIEELTVYDNILYSLNLRRMKDQGRVSQALARVGLAGYENRYPSELSGGERQRVAIARAIVKEPRIILADEPTGNLDNQTASSIISILREISRDHLILIVSHNTRDARTYADRIIRLADGRIVGDFSRNPEFVDGVHLQDGNLVCPEGKEITAEDVALINANASTQILLKNDKYIPTQSEEEDCEKIEIQKEKLSFFKKMRLSNKFLKRKTAAIALSSFMVAVIMVIMSLAQTIINFDSGEILSNEMSKVNQTSLLLVKTADEATLATLGENYRIEIEEDDIERIKEAGYKGNIYRVLNLTVPIADSRNAMGFYNGVFSKSAYIKESLGTMVVDEAFFERKFGGVVYLAQLEDPDPYGLVITDYIADCILATNRNYIGKTYEAILGDYLPAGWSYDSLKINAVIDTGYRAEHKALFDKLQNGKLYSTDAIYEDEDFLRFTNHVYESLGFSFSINPDFAENAYKNRLFFSTYKIVLNDTIEHVDKVSPYISFIGNNTNLQIPKDIQGNEVSMCIDEYNQIFGTSYSLATANTFVPHTVKITSYHYYDVDNKEPLYTMELKIVNLHSYNDTLIFSEENAEEYKKIIGDSNTFYSALYLDGSDGLGELFDTLDELNYEHQSFTIEGIHTMTKAVDVFIPIFELIAIVLCVGVIFILINFSSRMIKDKMHEIGILKALGTQNGTVGTVFGLQVVLIAVFTCVLSVIGYYYFIDLANDVLIGSLKRLAPGHIVLDLNFLTFQKNIARNNCILVFILSLVSLVPSMIKVKVIKPVKIIKTKD